MNAQMMKMKGNKMNTTAAELPADETLYCLWWAKQRTWKPQTLEAIKQKRLAKLTPA
jgi:hypothetical protein